MTDIYYARSRGSGYRWFTLNKPSYTYAERAGGDYVAGVMQPSMGRDEWWFMDDETVVVVTGADVVKATATDSGGWHNIPTIIVPVMEPEGVTLEELFAEDPHG